MQALSERLPLDEAQRGPLFSDPGDPAGTTPAVARRVAPWVVVSPPAESGVRGAANLVTGTGGAGPVPSP